MSLCSSCTLLNFTDQTAVFLNQMDNIAQMMFGLMELNLTVVGSCQSILSLTC